MRLKFVSDLHLDPARPEATNAFLEFLAGAARQADALYVLGDLFEVWVGDDDPDPHAQRIVAALAQYTAAGHACHVARGNRDFLLGETFARRSGTTLLGDETLIDVAGQKVLLMHGDALCTDDVGYQRMRRLFRQRWLQRLFLALPLERRYAIGRGLRSTSSNSMQRKAPEIMDVNATAVAATMRRHGVTTLLHGHTHRPALHRFELDGRPALRIVLGDWYEQGSVLDWAGGEPRLETLPYGTA